MLLRGRAKLHNTAVQEVLHKHPVDVQHGKALDSPGKYTDGAATQGRLLCGELRGINEVQVAP